MVRLASVLFVALALTACNQPAVPTSENATEEAQLIAPVVVPAGREAFVGAWAIESGQCTLEQDDPDSPLIMTAKGYDQYDSHCDFTSVAASSANVWTIAASCVAEGHPSTDTFTITVDGDRMTIAGSLATITRVRCP